MVTVINIVLPRDPISILVVIGIVILAIGWTAVRRKYEHRDRLPEELGHTAIVARRSPKLGGFLALYDDFLVHQPNVFSTSVRVPYNAITRLGVENYRWVNTARICIEYLDETGRALLAQFVCTKPELLVTALQRKIEEARQEGAVNRADAAR